ncbi:hypothetical protein RvY_18365, partial [Ramazzottius varieornatus]
MDASSCRGSFVIAGRRSISRALPVHSRRKYSWTNSTIRPPQRRSIVTAFILSSSISPYGQLVTLAQPFSANCTKDRCWLCAEKLEVGWTDAGFWAEMWLEVTNLTARCSDVFMLSF